MKTVTLSVANRQAVKQRAIEAFSGKRRGVHISFASADPFRRAGRDVKAVHGDVHALLAAGVLRKNPDGKIEFPFDAVHVDFVLKAA